MGNREAFFFGGFSDLRRAERIAMNAGLQFRHGNEFGAKAMRDPSEFDLKAFENLSALEKADIVVVSLDAGESDRDFGETCLKLLGAQMDRTARTMQILRERANKLPFVVDPKAAWLCGWAFSYGKPLVTFSTKGCDPVYPAAEHHAKSYDELEAVFLDLMDSDYALGFMKKAQTNRQKALTDG